MPPFFQSKPKFPIGRTTNLRLTSSRTMFHNELHLTTPKLTSKSFLDFKGIQTKSRQIKRNQGEGAFVDSISSGKISVGGQAFEQSLNARPAAAAIEIRLNLPKRRSRNTALNVPS